MATFVPPRDAAMRTALASDDPTGWRTAGRSVLDAARAVGGFVSSHPPSAMAPSLPAASMVPAGSPDRSRKDAERASTQSHADAVAARARTAPATSPQPPAGAGTSAPGKPDAPRPEDVGRMRAVRTPDGRTVHTNLTDDQVGSSSGARTPGTAFIVGGAAPQPFSEKLGGLAALGPRLGPGATADQINDSMNWSRYVDRRQDEERTRELGEEQQRAAAARAEYERRSAEIDPLEAARIQAESRYAGDQIKANAELARSGSAAQQVQRYAAAIQAARQAGDEASARSMEFTLRAYLSAYGMPMPAERAPGILDEIGANPRPAPPAGAPKK